MLNYVDSINVVINPNGEEWVTISPGFCFVLSEIITL